jgi:hypothetical protein
MFKLSDKTKKVIEKQTGFTSEEISSLDMDSLEERIESKIGKKLEYMVHNDDRLLGRGNIYMYLSRMTSMSKIDKKLSKI